MATLNQVDGWLAELVEELPLSPDASAMWDFRIPQSFPVHLHGALEAVRSDCIQDAVATLLHAVRQTDASLRDEFLRGGRP